jgi:hypothetical protein
MSELRLWPPPACEIRPRSGSGAIPAEPRRSGVFDNGTRHWAHIRLARRSRRPTTAARFRWGTDRQLRAAQVRLGAFAVDVGAVESPRVKDATKVRELIRNAKAA